MALVGQGGNGSGAGYVPAFLRMHVEGKVRFEDENGGEMPASVILSPYGLLPVIAAMADRLGKEHMGIELNPVLHEHDDTIAGFRCRLPQVSGLQLWILAVATEQLFGIGAEEKLEEIKVVRVDRIVSYLSTPPEERNEKECPWQQVPQLP
jgi:hypothetical protein